MCGIVGMIAKDGADRDVVQGMTAVLHHRGPDEQTTFVDGKVGIGFARLSIIDPPNGHQPVRSEDGNVLSVCNGEIYNHRAERMLLEQAGHHLNSDSDAEVIPHLYEEYSHECVDRLQGMFAVAVYDQAEQRVLLGRDRIGIKPLYFMETRRAFYFSSEIKAFLLAPEFRPEVDRRALDGLLAFKHIPGHVSLLKGIRILPPGHKLVLDVEQGSYGTERYYGLPWKTQTSRAASFDGAAGTVRRLFDRAVEARLMSDVPVGVALSGGLDSSAVVASAALQMSEPPKTFAVYLGDTINELDYARLVADRYKTDHHEVKIAPDELNALVPQIMWHLEEPMAVSEIPTFCLGRIARQHVKVLLSGEGADELFGGYVRFQPMNALSMLPKSMLEWGYIRGINGLTRRERRQLYSPEQATVLSADRNRPLQAALARKNDSVLNRILYYELTQQLPQCQLKRLDSLTMANSVEARVPFLDVGLVEYVMGLPSRLKVRGFREKLLLKAAMADRLPPEVVARRKLGMSNPVRALFRGGFRDVCFDELSNNSAVVGRYFSLSAIDQLFRAIGKGILSLPEQKIFHLYLFLKWHQVFVDGRAPSVAPCSPC